MPAAAFFDIDGTLTSDNVWKGLIQFFQQRGERRGTYLLFSLVHYPIYFVRPLIGEAQFRRQWAAHLPWFFRGYTELQMNELARWVAHDYVAHHVRRDIFARLQTHLAQGEVVALVSAAPQPIVSAIAQLWGVPHGLGSPAEFKNGRYTGGMAGEPCLDAYKARYAKQYLAQRNLMVDFAASHAYADSYADLGLFDMVGHPVAVYPDEKLAAHAKARGWEIVANEH